VSQHPLSADDLLSNSDLKRLGRRIHTFPTLDSTNAFLLRERDVAPDGALAWTEFQTAGRGRRGRTWTAPRGANILLSVLYFEPPDSPLLAGAALLGAVAAAEAIAAATDLDVAIRWPNDLVVDERKLGGVLAESARAPGGRRAVVLGVGVNCYQQPGHFPPELAARATSLEILSREPVDRVRLAAALVARLDHWLAQPRGAWAVTVAAWKGFCQDFGARVELLVGGRTITGTITDITEHGDLVVERDSGGRQVFEAATTTRQW
jgi:BirA family transcriptional regulator, biotin operon repressor / biotin---[acetyl-CoA-carboxylase] ligase